MTRLRIFLLGPPRILHNEKPVILKRRKALALLAYLAVSRRRHSRDTLAALLWPDTRPGRSYANLRNLIWILRQNGISDWLEVRHETMGVRSEARFWLDVAEFQERLGLSRKNRRGKAMAQADVISNLAGAVGLYHDHFMAGFGLRDSVAFDEWQTRQEETLRAGLAEALEKLVRFHRDRKQFDEAIDYARRRLALDPLCEPVQRELMSLYAAVGHRSAALETFETGARLLGEIGLSPDRETVGLRDRILKTDPIRSPEKATRETVHCSPKHNLPTHLTPFLGRTHEMAEIRRRLAEPACRLLTLAGPGGSGKTRLAIEAARERIADFPDGIFFVPLAAVDTPDSLIPAIIDALRAPLSRQPAGEDRRHPDRLLGHLRRKKLLLVLDNMEHLLAAAEEIAGILAAALGVKILATSRERLRLAGEWVTEIAGLPFPQENVIPGDEFPSVRLFLESAHRADSGFSPGESDLCAAARICRLVEGNPLGIEIASGWIPAMSASEIAERIETSLDFLTSRGRDVPLRHRSLRAVFEHSWGLLSERERRFFSRLAVFRGMFSREAALEVTEGTLSTLSALRDKSLLRQSPSGFYQIHELLRQYIEEKLRTDPDEYAESLDRLSRHYLRKLVTLETSIKGSGQDGALEELAKDGDHIRAAWLRAAERGWVDLMGTAVQSLFLFYDIRSRTQEGAEMFRGALEILNRAEPPAGEEENARPILLGLCAVCQGWFLRFVAPAECRALVRRGVEWVERVDTGADAAFVKIIATIAGAWPSRNVARRKLAESLTAYESIGDLWGKAMALEVLSYGRARSDPAAALCAAQESLRLRRGLGDRWGVALALYILGWVAEVQGLPHAAKKRYRESLRLRQQMGQDIDGIISCYNNLGRVARRTGSYEEATRMFEECLSLSREIGNPLRTAQSLTQLGMVAWDLGDGARARAHLEEAQPLLEAVDDPQWAGILLWLLGNVAAAMGDWDEARFLLNGGSADFEIASAGNGSVDEGQENVSCLPWLRLGRGRLAVASGDARTACEEFGRALKLCVDEGDHPTALESLLGIAETRVSTGMDAEAAELLSFALEHPAISPDRRARAEELLGGMAASPSPPTLDRGKRLTFTEIVSKITED